MYPVTSTYKTKIKELERVFQAKIQIQHSKGVLDLDDKDIALGSLVFNEASQAGEDFTIGGVVASDLTVSILNKPEYADIQFVGATLTASIGLQLAEDKWELQEVEPDTWEEVQVSEEAWEWVPLGVFHIDEIGKTRNVIRVKAIDAMINLDIPYSLSQLVYPATLLQIFTNICDVCDIQQGIVSFPNSNHVVEERPRDAATFRDMLAYVAELSGTFARTTRTGALELVWYEESGLTLTGANRFDFVPRDDRVQITGITATVDGVTYIAGGGVETEIYTEAGEDFETGTLDGVVAGEEGLELGLGGEGSRELFLPVSQDTYANYTSPNNVYGASTTLSVIGENAYRHWIYIQFDLEKYKGMAPENVLEAKIMLYYYSNWGYGVKVDVNRVLNEWDEMELTWNNKPAISQVYQTYNYESGAYGWREFDITDMVKEWVSGEHENYGTALTRSVHETYREMSFRSSNYTDNPDLQPYLYLKLKSYLNSSSRLSPPLDLSSLGTNPDLRAAWQATVPEGTSVKVLTAVTGAEDVYEVSRTEEGAGFGEGTLDGVVAGESGLELENDPYLYFNGTSAQVKIDYHADLQVTNNFKFRFKVKINDINQTDKYLITKSNQPAIIFGYVSKTIEFYAESYTNTNPRSGSGIVINDTGWHEVIYEYDGINWAGYLDGNEIFKVKRTFSLRTNTGNLYFGSSPSANFLDGYLDDIEIWKNGVLQGHWKFDEGSGTMAYDSSGGGHHGEIINAEWVQNHTPSGSRTSLPLDLSGLGQAVSSNIEWDATIPEDTTLTIETGISNDPETEPATWSEATSGQPIPSISVNDDLTSKYLWVRQTLETEDTSITPVLHSLTVTVEGDTAVGVVVLKPAEPQSDIFTLYLGGATDGTFILTDGTTDTDPIDYDCTAEDIQTALEDLYGEGNVTAETDTDFTITFVPAVGDSGLTADFTSLTGATDPALTLNTAYDAGDWEEQAKEITITNLPEGDFTGKWLWIKQVLETSDPAVTPLLENFRLYSVTEGGADYLVDLSNNPLLQDNYETVLGTIYGAVKGVSFYPFTSSWQGNPAVQAGDIITQIDRDGKPYKTLVTHSTYKYRGASTLQGKGLPVKAKGYKGSTNRKFAEIIRKIDEVVGDKLTTLEQAQLHATEMIANMLGGHAIFTDDAIYIADSEDLDEAVKIWKWGIGGFGYSSTGKDGPYTTAITADGTIVAMLVAAGIVTADMIHTGILQSQDGSSWFNLNDGTFNLKNMFKWVDSLLTLNQPDDAARLLVGPNVFAMQAYDETEEGWVNKIYFDPVRGKYVFDGLLSADAIQAVAAVIDYVVSDVTFTQILYAEKGNISELTVDQLDTSTMVAKYLNSDTSNVDYIKIWGQHIHWIEAVVKDGDPTPTVQLTDRKNNPLYWVDEDSIGTFTTFEETDYPVVVYEYDLNPKLKIDFELDPVTGYNVPIMTWGMGSDPTGQTNKGKGYIYKDETGLIFRYINEYNKTFDLRIGEDGIQTTGIGDAPASKGLVRNTFVSTDDPGSSDGEDGDVWLKYQDTGGGGG